MNKLKNLVFYMLIIITVQARSAEFTPLLGLNLGYNYLKGQDAEIDKQGYSVGIKAIGSFNLKSWIFDGAIGYQSENLFADYIEIHNYTPFAELSLRKTFGNYFSLGPIVQAQSGVYRTMPGVQEKNKVIVNAGLQALYDSRDNNPRYELSLMNSIDGINNRELYSVRLGIQFPFGGKEKPAAVRTISKKTESIESISTIVVPGFVTKEIYQDQKNAKFKMSNKKLGFEIRSSELDSSSVSKIKKLVKFIVANKISIGMIKISGHTDELGSDEFNKKLSLSRAEVVKKHLVDAGIDKNVKIETHGFGYDQPLMDKNNQSLLVKNRRTEIEFFDVVQNNMLSNKIKQIIKNP